MATKRTKEIELTDEQLILWLRGQIGESTIEVFSQRLGMTRQAISGVLSGRREPGLQMMEEFKALGVVRRKNLYTVRVPANYELPVVG